MCQTGCSVLKTQSQMNDIGGKIPISLKSQTMTRGSWHISLGVLVGESKGVQKETTNWRLPEGGQTKTHNEPHNVKLKRRTS